METLVSNLSGAVTSRAYRELRAEIAGSGPPRLLRLLHNLTERELARRAVDFLAASPLGEALRASALRTVCRGWVRLLRISAEGGFGAGLSAAELAVLLTGRLREAFARDLGRGRDAEACGAAEPAHRADPSSERLSPDPARARPSAKDSLSVTLEAVAVRWRGERLPLSPTEARMLAHLVQHGFAPWARLEALSGGGAEPNMITLRVFVHRLRKKLREAGADASLKTLRGRGLALVLREGSKARRSEEPLQQAA